MDTDKYAQVVFDAHLRLIALNFGSWKPEIDAWLHSKDAELPLQELLMHVPCSPTLH
jgi:hypothetical protein